MCIDEEQRITKHRSSNSSTVPAIAESTLLRGSGQYFTSTVFHDFHSQCPFHFTKFSKRVKSFYTVLEFYSTFNTLGFNKVLQNLSQLEVAVITAMILQFSYKDGPK